MPKSGELYKHKQIKDVVYSVVEINTNRRTLTLKGSPRGETVTVTFTQLDKSYERYKK